MIIVLVPVAKNARPSAVPVHATEIENGEEFGEWRRGRDRWEDESASASGGNIVIYALSLARHMHTTHVHRNIGHQTERGGGGERSARSASDILRLGEERRDLSSKCSILGLGRAQGREGGREEATS